MECLTIWYFRICMNTTSIQIYCSWDKLHPCWWFLQEMERTCCITTGFVSLKLTSKFPRRISRSLTTHCTDVVGSKPPLQSHCVNTFNKCTGFNRLHWLQSKVPACWQTKFVSSILHPTSCNVSAGPTRADHEGVSPLPPCRSQQLSAGSRLVPSTSVLSVTVLSCSEVISGL